MHERREVCCFWKGFSAIDRVNSWVSGHGDSFQCREMWWASSSTDDHIRTIGTKQSQPCLSPLIAVLVSGFEHTSTGRWRSAGNVELVPTLLSTPLKPEAHGLQAGLPAGFSKWRELWSVRENCRLLSCVWLQPLLMESFKFKGERLIHRSHRKQSCWSGRSLVLVRCFSAPQLIYFPSWFWRSH